MQRISTSTETAVYPKRWLILISFCMVTVLTFFCSRSFTAANQIYADYYDVSLVIIDWAVLALHLGAVVATPVFAWFFFKQVAGFRIISITAACCLLISFSVILLSIQFPSLYPLMVLSNLLQGIAYIVGYTVGPSFAVLWFPDHQVGIAIASDLLSQNLGTALGAIVTSLVLRYPQELPTNYNPENINQTNATWFTETHNTLLKLYVPCACILLILIVFFLLFVTDLPPKPPTYALWLKQVRNNSTTAIDTSFSQFLLTLKSLYFEQNFILCSIILGISFNMIVVFQLQITSIVEQFDVQRIGIYISNDIIGGILLGIFAFSNTIFGFASAKISNRWRNYSLQILVGLCVTFAVLVSMTLAFYYRYFYVFCVGILLYSIGTRIFAIPLLEVITRHTYPIDETLVSVLVGANGSVIIIIIGEIARIISSSTSVTNMLIFVCTCILAATILAFLINPKDKRHEIDLAREIQANQLPVSDETSPLLNK